MTSGATIKREPASKTCLECRETRPADAFLPSRFTADGLTDRCKPCIFREARANREQREARRLIAKKDRR